VTSTLVSLAMSQLQFCAVAKTKQARKHSLLPNDWLVPDDILHSTKEVISLPDKLLSPRELEITDSSTRELLQHLHSPSLDDRWTSLEVTTAFCKRASIAEQATNCLTEVFFNEAFEQAKAVDAFLEKNGKPMGALAGLPVSVKDCFNVKGQDSTLGFVCWANAPQESDSLMIKLLRQAGAILYCKTNVPTAMMIAETVNNVFGRTLNPYHTEFTSGGSSGGEAALIAMKGSPLGVGTDIGA
jgi:amidase